MKKVEVTGLRRYNIGKIVAQGCRERPVRKGRIMASFSKMNLSDFDAKGKRVIVREDFNVPQDKSSGAISDDRRIRAALPTLEHLLQEGARVIVVAHLGRPKGYEEKYTLRPVAERLSELIHRPVELAADVVGEDAKAKAAALQDGEILLLENVRFEKAETKNDPDFARALASLGEVFVNDAFGCSHRAHASTQGIAHYLPAYAGFLMQKELEIMGKALENPVRPFVAILGGAKVSDKIGVIENLLDKVDALLIGGGMAYTFLAAEGRPVGQSLLEKDKIDLAKSLLKKAEEKGVELLLPTDTVVADHFAADARAETCSVIPEQMMGLDIGPETVERFSKKIKDARTIVWNGPMGVFEFPAFAGGTKAIAEAAAKADAVSIIGGGDSAAAIQQLGFADQVTHISTGGGASLEFLEGKNLPGVDCLLDREARRVLAAGNWKMNAGTPAEAEALLKPLIEVSRNAKNRMMIATPFTALDRALQLCEGTHLTIAAENCHFEEKGAFTGEISPAMLARMGVDYVILGHSERRALFGESDESVCKKVKAARHWGLHPIICVGETLEEREADKTFERIESQVRGALRDLPSKEMPFVLFAYEPVWAIGTGKTASSEQAEEVCAFIRRLIEELYGADISSRSLILYGGSVKASNAAELFACDNIDGGLVGGASLKVDEFAAIANA